MKIYHQGVRDLWSDTPLALNPERRMYRPIYNSFCRSYPLTFSLCILVTERQRDILEALKSRFIAGFLTLCKLWSFRRKKLKHCFCKKTVNINQYPPQTQIFPGSALFVTWKQIFSYFTDVSVSFLGETFTFSSLATLDPVFKRTGPSVSVPEKVTIGFPFTRVRMHLFRFWDRMGLFGYASKAGPFGSADPFGSISRFVAVQRNESYPYRTQKARIFWIFFFLGKPDLCSP